MHSRDKALKSLCIFSSSFFTASGLLVPDMIHHTPRQFQSGANSGTVRPLGRQAAPSTHLQTFRSPPLGLHGDSAGPGLPTRAKPSALRSLLANSPGAPAVFPHRKAPPAPAEEPTMWAGPSRCRGAQPHRLSKGNPARSLSVSSPKPTELPTPLAESPTIPSAAGTRQQHFRAPRPPPPRWPTRGGLPQAGRGQGRGHALGRLGSGRGTTAEERV